MKESKNIERLFQEKLKDLEMTPNPAVWNKIEQSMAVPKKSKKGFVWFFYGSVAALFLIGFFLFKDNNTVQHPTSASKKISTNKKVADSSTVAKTTSIQKPVTAAVTQNNNQNKEAIVTKTGIQKKQIAKGNYTNTTTNSRDKNVINALTNKKPEEIITAVKSPKTNHQTLPYNNIKKEIANTTITSASEKQNLEEVVNNEVNKIKKHQKHWSIAPVVSELFYNTLSNKSPVDSRLDNATKNGENSTSFGLKIAYQASKKWRIQTGIHQISLAQTTQNIAIASISRNASFANSSQTLNSPTVSDNNEITFISTSSSENELRQSNNSNNQLRQSFGYIEIPIEINYQLFETNKIQFHLVGGLSSLFLTTNNLQIENPNYSYSDGEATNLNKVNFSFNLGTAAEYHFSNQWFFNLSPMLKMQTQTFNSNSNQPYVFGISTGINYQF